MRTSAKLHGWCYSTVFTCVTMCRASMLCLAALLCCPWAKVSASCNPSHGLTMTHGICMAYVNICLHMQHALGVRTRHNRTMPRVKAAERTPPPTVVGRSECILDHLVVSFGSCSCGCWTGCSKHRRRDTPQPCQSLGTAYSC